MHPTYYSFRQHDTDGSIVLVVPSGLSSDIATAAATFSARDRNGWATLDAGAATISAVTTAADGSKGATLTYPNTTYTVGAVGTFFGQFAVTYPSGAREIMPKSDDLWWTVTQDFASLDDSVTEADLLGELQTQAAHGLAVGNFVRFGSGTWSKALGDSDATLADAVVVSVPSTSQFRVVYLANREVTIAAHGHGAAGTKVYLSQAAAGIGTAVRPLVYPIQQLARVKDANTLILQSFGVEAA